jgi:oxygen-independent coproporphyrinogen-3 oxidase
MTTSHIDEPAWIWPRSAYVHIPFCAHHCGYCDFAVAVGKDDRRGAYLEALGRELERLGGPQPVDTLFFGGGTPSQLTAEDLSTLLDRVLDRLPLRPGHEFSLEANPGSITDDKLAVLVERGLTRVSLGCQSFDPALLRTLERDHEPADVPRAVARLRRHGLVVSLDLIFGVPGQSAKQWASDLEQALALEPDGIATYGLTYEKGTRLWKQRREGLVLALDEETELAFYERAMDRLEAAGYRHYELSNFARPGKECRHNEVYWANDAYFGFGMGAAEYARGVRRLNTRDLDGYVRKALAGQTTAFQSETLGPRERALETLGQNLRRDCGAERRRFLEQTEFELEAIAGAAAPQLVDLGLVVFDDAGIRLTHRGKCVADAVIGEFWKGSR